VGQVSMHAISTGEDFDRLDSTYHGLCSHTLVDALLGFLLSAPICGAFHSDRTRLMASSRRRH
jgi:hypothetical protein